MSPSRTSVPLSWRTTRFLKSFDRVQVGVGGQIDLDERAFGVAESRQEIIVPQRLAHLRRTDVERRHPVRLQPDAHGKGAAAENVRPLDAADRGQPRLDDAGEIIGDLVRLQNVRGETEISGGELRIGRYDVDDRNLGFRAAGRRGPG